MPVPRHSIFISYRRLDSVFAVDQLDERLKHAFGAEVVFRDASSIAPGAVFPDDIRQALAQAKVALVVVGPGWLGAATDPDDPSSQRRLDDPEPPPRVSPSRLNVTGRKFVGRERELQWLDEAWGRPSPDTSTPDTSNPHGIFPDKINLVSVIGQGARARRGWFWSGIHVGLGTAGRGLGGSSIEASTARAPAIRAVPAPTISSTKPMPGSPRRWLSRATRGPKTPHSPS